MPRLVSDLLIDGPARAPTTVVLAHGAGAPMDTPFMNTVARGLAAAGLRAVRFEFPYMAARRTDGKRRGPDRPVVLQQAWHEVVERVGDREHMVIGGKSMGGRIASEVADAAGVAGVVCLGYPFHPPGRPDKLRTAHLETMTKPVLVCQGTRDRLGNQEEVQGYALSSYLELCWLPDGDHDLKPRVKSGYTHDENLAAAANAIAHFAVNLGA